MANTRLDMKTTKQLLRLYTTGVSKLQISKQLGFSRKTIRKYIDIFHNSQLTYEELIQLSDSDLDTIFDVRSVVFSSKEEALHLFFPYVSKELKRVGVTREILWKEYKIKHPQGYAYTTFCEHYKKWKGKVSPSMHMEHKAGDKMFVDYTGKKLSIIDKNTGEIQEVEVFVSILGASGMTFVEATLSQKREDFLGSLVKSLHFYGGVPNAIVPDNLRTAVKKSDRYEPKITDSLLDFASHYSTTILPTRAYHPKDKSLVENAVRIIYTRIFAPLRNEQFFSLESLNQAILPLLEKHNGMLFKIKKYSRADVFHEIEKPALHPLPLLMYDFKQFSKATVHKSSHVYLSGDKHYYSVPFAFIGKKVLIVYSKTGVEIYEGQQKIASHERNLAKYHYSTIKEHMPSSHRFVTEWHPDKFILWADKIGESCKIYISHILGKKQHPEQSYKTCLGILHLTKKVSAERLNKACKLGLSFEKYNYDTIKSILEKGLDQIEPEEDTEESELPKHQNIRGKEYYQ